MNKKITFIDFCSGIGSGRLGLENAGLKCVGFSEIDKNAIHTYSILHSSNEKNYGDLTKIKVETLPNFDLMIAGFPCQSFSVLGKQEGFDDKRGQIIYYLIEILKAKEVPFFILENVKGLVNHDKGKTLKEIIRALEKAGYKVFWQVLNSLHYGVPQMRERVYFMGFRSDIAKNKLFKWPTMSLQPRLDSFLCDTDNDILDHKKDITFQKLLNNKYNNGKFNMDELIKEDYLVIDTRQSDLRLYRNKVPTLRNGRNGLLYVKAGKLHKLSGYESLLLQGFNVEYASKVKGKVPDNILLSQAGNAMTVTVIQSLAFSLLDYIKE